MDTYIHVCARMGKEATDRNAFRGFRRVWDRQPSQSEIEADRGLTKSF